MPEQQETEKKKGKIAKRVEKWFDLGLLAFLIIAAALLQASWKLTTLLLIILAACTILPKPFRKWFWLSIGIIVIALIIWVFLPDRNGNWRPYTFDKELAAMEAERSIPTEEDAAFIYNQLLESYDPNSFDKDFLSWKNRDLILSEFWKSKDYPKAASWIGDNQQIIDQLMLACKTDKCRFPVAGNLNATELKPPCNFQEVTDFWWFSDKRLIPMKHWCELLIISANNDIAEGRIDEAIKKYITVLQMANHLCQQPTPMDLMMGIAINLRGVYQINKFVVTGEANDEYLHVLDNALQGIDYDWRSDLLKILDREKLMFKSFMCAMFYQTNSEKRVRLNRDPNSTLSSQMHIHYTLSGKPRLRFIPPKPSNYWRRKFTKAKTIFCWFFVPSTPQKAAMIIDNVHEQYYAMAEPKFDWEKEPKQFSLMTVRLNFRWLTEIMSRICEIDWPKFHDRYLKATAWKRVSQLIIALRHHKNKNGHWPETLDDIKSFTPAEIFVDPINGDSFVYKPNEENFTLYSKGPNGIDEEGKLNESCDDWMIWPQESRKTKKEKADVEQH